MEINISVKFHRVFARIRRVYDGAGGEFVPKKRARRGMLRAELLLILRSERKLLLLAVQGADEHSPVGIVVRVGLVKEAAGKGVTLKLSG